MLIILKSQIKNSPRSHFQTPYRPTYTNSCVSRMSSLETSFSLSASSVLEYVGSGYRTVMANAPVMTFLTLGLCTMPWMAWGLAHWASFALLIHGLQFVTILCIW